MKFKCRKCDYFGNSHNCPLCSNPCKIVFNNNDERTYALQIHSSFADYPTTKDWAQEIDPLMKEMETRGMVNIKVNKRKRIAYKNIQHPIWLEIVIESWLTHHL